MPSNTAEYARQWRLDHPKSVSAYCKKWRDSHPEKVKQYTVGRDPKNVRRYQLARYGITPDEFDQLMVDQDGKCAICGLVMKKPMIDHDHKCCPGFGSCGSCIRGLLCNSCNTSIGKFHDSPRILLRAIQYLKQPSILKRQRNEE